MTLWPRSLATRTALVLLVGLAVVQVVGLTIHALDSIDLQHLAQARTLGIRIATIYRSVARIPAAERETAMHELDVPEGYKVRVETGPPIGDLPPMSPAGAHLLKMNMRLWTDPPDIKPTAIILRGSLWRNELVAALHMPSGGWLSLRVPVPPVRPWHSPGFLYAFLMMTAAAALLSVWAVRRLTAPVRTLALAAEALGRDVDAPPLPETGPLEVALAAQAFNTMAKRIRKFVQDRTFMLTAIGHDLRTPITRLKLRAEFMEDDELRAKMLADLDELEAMVSATLAFGRDVSAREPMVSLDLAELARTILDEAGDARPSSAEDLHYTGPDHLTIRGRLIPLKRAIGNLVNNAIAYGGSAHVLLSPAADGVVRLHVEDEGPGVPPAELERVFDPFHRVEASRNRETGGVGLGLPITRNILRAHGGDVVLCNRPTGGARATVTLPA